MNPYSWHFPQRNQTMYMATIGNFPFKKESKLNSLSFFRQSSFQNKDIPGAQAKLNIPTQVHRVNYNNSTFIQPLPQTYLIKNNKTKNNLLVTDDIQGAKPKCNQFKTNRVTNPLIPQYKLPYVQPIDLQPPRKFQRNTLEVSDITNNHKRIIKKSQKQDIEGSHPSKLFRTIQAVPRLQVQDINKQGSFISKRTKDNFNPLQPIYTWRDTPQYLNKSFGQKQKIKSINEKVNLSLNTHDIEGAQVNSSNQRRYFFQKRKDYRDPLFVQDLPKAKASSLKKGITTKRITNALVPRYDYLC